MRISGTAAAAAVILSLVTGQGIARTVTTIASGGAAGNNPDGPLLRGYGGVLYGTSFLGGGRANAGFVFQLTRPAAGQAAWTSSLIYAFAGGADGSAPSGGLIADTRIAKTGAVLYGATLGGGIENQGTVFSLTQPAASGSAWTKTTLASFSGAAEGPVGYLTLDKNGNIFGVSQGGTVWKLSPPAKVTDGWSLATLYNFTGGPEGGHPLRNAGPLLVGGHMFGIMTGGGDSKAEAGTVWRLDPPRHHGSAWTETTLVTFTGANGLFPDGGLTAGSDGTIYGTSSGGGATGNGLVFALVPTGAGARTYNFTPLWSFVSGAGSSPNSKLLIDEAGTLFGTTYADSGYGGVGNGTIFRLRPPISSSSIWRFTSLYTFPDGNQGGNPLQLTHGKNELIYGVTQFGGSGACSSDPPTGCGTAYILKGSGYSN